MPPRRNQAVPQGHQVLHREVPRRASSLRPRPARAERRPRRRKASEYSKQLREKQKIKRIYGVSEQQFRNTFEGVTREPGITGTTCSPPSRAVSTTSCIAWASRSSRKAARQLIRAPSRRDQRPAASTSRATTWCRAKKCGLRGKPREGVGQGGSGKRPRGRRSRGSRSMRQGGRPRHGAPDARDIPIAAQEQLVVELYSK